jgi:glycosyltransferase involved in cell wall biosynthesis
VGLFLLICSLVHLLWRIRPDIVFSTAGMNLALIVLARLLLTSRIRLLVRESSVVSVRLNETQNPRIFRYLFKCLYKQVDKVICNSDSMVQEIAQQFNLPEKKMTRIYNPIDIQLVRDLGSGGGNPYFGAGPHLVAAGRLSHEKGFDLLIAAMPRIAELLPHARLTILGDGPLKSALAGQARGLGLTESVSFVGFQQNPWPYFCHADLLVVPSRRESFGNVLVEALALGTPAIAFDCPGAIGEIYGEHPAVRLVAAENAAGLIDAIIESCSARNGKRIVPITSPDWLAKFSPQQIMREYNAVLSQ